MEEARLEIWYVISIASISISASEANATMIYKGGNFNNKNNKNNRCHVLSLRETLYPGCGWYS